MESIKAQHGTVFAMTTTGERGHDMAIVPELPGLRGRVNHIAFWLDQRVELYRAADVLVDAGIPIEFGPGRHGLGEQEYLYFREPSGLRVEFNAGGYRLSQPDWEPVVWTIDQGANVWYKNQAMPTSMFESFPKENELEASEDAKNYFRATTFFELVHGARRSLRAPCLPAAAWSYSMTPSPNPSPFPEAPIARPDEQVIDIHGHAGPKVDALVTRFPEFAHGMKMMAEGSGAASMRQNAEVVLPRAAARFASMEARLRDLDRIGIDLQVVSPSPHLYSYWADEALAEEIVGLTNEAMLATVAQAPGRLAGIGMAALQHPELAARQVRAAMAQGLKGIEISTAVGARELSDPTLDAVWAAAQDTGAVIFIHPLGTSLGQRLNEHYLYNSLGQPAETTIALSHLIFSGVFDRFAGLKVIAAHGGGYLPTYIGRSDHAWSVRPEVNGCAHPPSHYLSRIWYDTVLFDDVQLRYVIDRVGSDRVMFGTDYAFDMGDYNPGRLASSLSNSPTRAAVLSGTARTVFGL